MTNVKVSNFSNLLYSRICEGLKIYYFNNNNIIITISFIYFIILFILYIYFLKS